MIGPLPRLLASAILLCGAAGCATTGYKPQPFPKAEGTVPATTADTSATEGVALFSLVGVARTLLGTPYQDGGSSPAGFDCSGFVQYVFSQVGWQMPRTVEDQAEAGVKVTRERVQPGDLVFFRTTARRPTHVGIAVSATEFIHAPNERGVVKVDSFDAGYWNRRFIEARRLQATTQER